MTRRSFISKLVAAAGLVGVAPAAFTSAPAAKLSLTDYIVEGYGRHLEDVLRRDSLSESPWLALVRGDLKYRKAAENTKRAKR